MALPDVPPYVEGWIRQLLEADTLRVLRDAGNEQVEVRLIANHGKVRERPAILLHCGLQALVAVADVATSNGNGHVVPSLR